MNEEGLPTRRQGGARSAPVISDVTIDSPNPDGIAFFLLPLGHVGLDDDGVAHFLY